GQSFLRLFNFLRQEQCVALVPALRRASLKRLPLIRSNSFIAYDGPVHIKLDRAAHLGRNQQRLPRKEAVRLPAEIGLSHIHRRDFEQSESFDTLPLKSKRDSDQDDYGCPAQPNALLPRGGAFNKLAQVSDDKQSPEN